MFEERQHFNKNWLIIFVLPLAAFFVFGATRYFVLNIPFGENSLEDIVLLGTCATLTASVFIFIRIELLTKVDGTGVHFQFYPFQRKFSVVEWKNIREAYVRRYKPFKEYGGWGIRYGVHGKAYNIAGKYGLQLVLPSGKKILIGTQRPELMEEVLKKYADQLAKA